MDINLYYRSEVYKPSLKYATSTSGLFLAFEIANTTPWFRNIFPQIPLNGAPDIYEN